MARGWESKSVEAQQEEASHRHIPSELRPTPEGTARHRAIENIQLSLRHVMHQLERTQNTRLREILERAKKDLEKQIEGFRKES